MTCTFFGHRDTPQRVKLLLRDVLMDLIEQQGVNCFYVGNQGNFDRMAAGLLEEIAKETAIRYEMNTVKCTAFRLQRCILCPRNRFIN